MTPTTRGLIEYDCFSAPDCAANGGRCLCPRRWTGERAPFPAEGGSRGTGYRRGSEAGPKLGDLFPEALRRKNG